MLRTPQTLIISICLWGVLPIRGRRRRLVANRRKDERTPSQIKQLGGGSETLLLHQDHRRAGDPIRVSMSLREPDRRRRDEKRPFPLRTKNVSTTQNNRLTAKAPYKSGANRWRPACAGRSGRISAPSATERSTKRHVLNEAASPLTKISGLHTTNFSRKLVVLEVRHADCMAQSFPSRSSIRPARLCRAIAAPTWFGRAPLHSAVISCCVLPIARART